MTLTIFSGVLAATSSMSMPPSAACHEDDPAVGSDPGMPRVDLAEDIGGRVDQDFFDRQPFDRHAEDFVGTLFGFVGGFGQFNAAGFATSTDKNLGFDDDGSAEADRNAARTALGVVAASPLGTGIPYRAKMRLDWYSCKFKRKPPRSGGLYGEATGSGCQDEQNCPLDTIIDSGRKR
jgi:hypothetical protein